jgi:stage II sporulation protein D
MMNFDQPVITVGIKTAQEISFIVKDVLCTAYYDSGHIRFNGGTYDFLFYNEEATGGTFIIKDVTIGINFHWQRQKDQKFTGGLKVIVDGQNITAVNIIGVEDYLESVISSEMNSEAMPEYLKAHSVISRSWVLSQIEKNKKESPKPVVDPNSDEYIFWWDHDDHTNFDVCADDHCQRYQGITMIHSDSVRDAVRQTCGEVLTYNGEICDARFSKCCGGAMEEFQYCWSDVDHPYLHRGFDRDVSLGIPLSDLTKEANAEKWILSRPTAFCNNADANILKQVMNDYDQETKDFYRWIVEYKQEELSALIAKKSGIDYGEIIDLQPVARGTSGRIWKLKIVGSKATKVIGKELEIRRVLSESHLYSSAFIVEKVFANGGDLPSSFILHGAGWGHGVGLCQIGAAVMAARGYQYKQILAHYYKGASITKKYQ